MRVFSNLAFLVFLVALICGKSAEAANPDAREILRTIFTADIESVLALSAAPEHLRSQATIFVYGTSGYAKYRDGTNGITCLLNRDGFFYGSSAFKPTCWDSEGATSYVPVMLEVGRLLADGKDTNSIKAEIDAGFRTGRFHRPKRTGIAYMLTGDVNLDIKSGKVLQNAFPGHYMIYAPGVSGTDIGYSAEAAKQDGSLPFIFAGGAGGSELAYLIAVPHH